MKQFNWKVVIASAGCLWFIEKLLSAVGVQIELHANPGHFETGKGLLMEMPSTSTFFSSNLGIDKIAAVRHYLAADGEVAFAGDGYPDLDAACLVPPKMRFARGDLATMLLRSRREFRPFSTWSDIARELVVEQRSLA